MTARRSDAKKHAGEEETSSGLWRATGATAQGAQHRREDRPNEDAFGWWPTGWDDAGNVVVAVADGHGHARGLRAHAGASLAVDAALAVGRSRLEEPTPASGAHHLVRHLPEELTTAWRALVRADLSRNPLREEELAGLAARAGAGDRRAVESAPEVAYGTTLLVALATARQLAIAQVGDGDILVVSSEGRTCRPLMRDAAQVANRTWSLASSDAPARFRTACIGDRLAALVVLATDGYSNSFSDDVSFEQVGPDLLDLVHGRGLDAVGESLPEWLATTSEEGSGDDVTVALAARGPLGSRAVAGPVIGEASS